MIWRIVFGVAAAFNFAVGGSLLLATERVAQQMPGAHDLYDLQFAGLMIAVFGVGYAMVARDPAGNRGIVWIGALGKLGVVALSTMYLLADAFPMRTYALALGDLLFVALFALFLWRGPRAR